MRSFLLSLMLLIGINGMAQDVLDTIAVAACECMDNLDVENMDSEKFTMQVGLCMIEKAMPYADVIKRDYDIDFKDIDGAAGEKLGQLIGIRMATTCPDKLMAFANMQAEEPELESMAISGIINDIKTEGFNILYVEDDSGRKYSLLWLSYFENSYDLLKRKKELVGKKVSVTYEEQEFFDPRISEYRKYKVIKEFTFES